MNASIALRWLHAEEILLGRKQFEAGVSRPARKPVPSVAPRRRDSHFTAHRHWSCGIRFRLAATPHQRKIGRVGHAMKGKIL